MSSGEQDALRELINCVEKMTELSPHAELMVWRETRDWLHLALQEYKAALSHEPGDTEWFWEEYAKAVRIALTPRPPDNAPQTTVSGGVRPEQEKKP